MNSADLYKVWPPVASFGTVVEQPFRLSLADELVITTSRIRGIDAPLRTGRYDLKDPVTGKNRRDFDTILWNVLVFYGVSRPIRQT